MGLWEPGGTAEEAGRAPVDALCGRAALRWLPQAFIQVCYRLCLSSHHCLIVVYVHCWQACSSARVTCHRATAHACHHDRALCEHAQQAHCGLHSASLSTTWGHRVGICCLPTSAPVCCPLPASYGGDRQVAPDCRPLHWFGFHVMDLTPLLRASGEFASCEIEVLCRPYPQDWRAALVVIQVRDLWFL